MNRLLLIFSALFFLGAVPLFANYMSHNPTLLESATEGDMKAQYEIAKIYEQEALADGDLWETAPEPWGKAIFWYEAAAAQGSKQAQYALLARGYRGVRGVDR